MQEPRAPEDVWKSQTEEKASMQFALTPEQLCAMARSREKLNAWVGRVMVAVAIVLAGVFLYNVYRIDQPWIRLGQVWTLGVLVYLLAPAFEDGRAGMGTGDPCGRYLVRQHEERRGGYLRIRRRLFLLVPGMVACWWGGGAGTRFFVMTGVALGLVFIAFGKAAEKAGRDRDDVMRAIE